MVNYIWSNAMQCNVSSRAAGKHSCVFLQCPIWNFTNWRVSDVTDRFFSIVFSTKLASEKPKLHSQQCGCFCATQLAAAEEWGGGCFIFKLSILDCGSKTNLWQAECSPASPARPARLSCRGTITSLNFTNRNKLNSSYLYFPPHCQDP